MSLKKQIDQMRQEIGYYKDSAGLEGIKSDLKTISMRLNDASKKVEDEAKKHECLKEIDGVDLYCEIGDEALHKAKVDFQVFKTLWEELEDKSVSDEKNTLFTLTESLKNTSKLFTEKHQIIWNDWLDEQKSLAQVDDFILEQQRSVHRNIELYNSYRSVKREFDAQLNDFDFYKNQLVKIKQFAQKCATFKEQMNTEDLPDGVKKLFDKLNSIGDIALVSLLTPEVMEWLNKNNKLDTLVVRQR